jgi:uncharacterized protein (DUF2384 family)
MALVQLNICALAEDVLGGGEAADLWLNERLPILGGKTPLEVSRSDTGALVVAQMLAKIDWGAAA